jgi:glycosyltransferase involved in cell wall biosynthesis
MRIAVVGTRGFPDVQGGIEKHCENLYPRLVELGCEVTVFTRKPYVDKEKRTHRGVELIPLSCPKNKYLEAFIHTLKGIIAATRLDPDLLHVHGIGPSMLVPFARLLKMRVVMTHHGPDYRRRKWGLVPRLVLRLGEAVGTRSSDALICVSGTIAREIRAKFGCRPFVIPNGLGTHGRLESEEALRRFSLAKGKYILAVGRFVPEKGFDYLIEAFGRVVKTPHLGNENPVMQDGWKLVIVGGADHEDRYSVSLRRKAEVVPNIVLTGFLTGRPLQELYTHAGLFVVASFYEGLPIVLLEAMGHGSSCLASDIPANKDVGLEPGRYFRAGDVADLAEKILRLSVEPLTDAERSKQVSDIEKRYNWDDIARRTLDVYKMVLGGPPEWRRRH